MKKQDFELKKDNEYIIQPYWEDIQIRARYVGNKKNERGLIYVFVFEKDNEKNYVFMDEDCMAQENDVLKYNMNLSFPPSILNKNLPDPKSKVKTERSELLKILEDLGESL